MSAATSPELATPSDVIRAALNLPAWIREELADLLYNSLDDERTVSVEFREEWRSAFEARIREIENGEIELVDGHATLAEWHAELQSRVDGIKDGTMKTYSIEETMDYLYAELARSRAARSNVKSEEL